MGVIKIVNHSLFIGIKKEIIMNSRYTDPTDCIGCYFDTNGGGATCADCDHGNFYHDANTYVYYVDEDGCKKCYHYKSKFKNKPCFKCGLDRPYYNENPEFGVTQLHRHSYHSEYYYKIKHMIEKILDIKDIKIDIMGNNKFIAYDKNYGFIEVEYTDDWYFYFIAGQKYKYPNIEPEMMMKQLLLTFLS